MSSRVTGDFGQNCWAHPNVISESASHAISRGSCSSRDRGTSCSSSVPPRHRRWTGAIRLPMAPGEIVEDDRVRGASDGREVGDRSRAGGVDDDPALAPDAEHLGHSEPGNRRRSSRCRCSVDGEGAGVDVEDVVPEVR